jgi:GntR family transcriptional regulator / MocR family aminotransferase
MPNAVTALPLALGGRAPHTTLTRWLYEELRRAILDRRLPHGTRLPATRDFAVQHGVSRGTVVTVFEQLQSEGYLTSRAGAGTRINARLTQDVLKKQTVRPPTGKLPVPLRGLPRGRPARPFRHYEPSLNEFPIDIWARVASRRLRRATSSLLAGGDPRGYAPLREAVAAYLTSSRGVNCSAESIVILSGVQQGLDLVARLIIRAGEAVWMEDPGYFGAISAFRQSGAKIIPVPVDEHGLSVTAGERLCKNAKAAYLTPAHQSPLGVAMPVERRLAVLSWAQRAGAFLIEDDYDSEYRFEGRPIPALQGLDKNGSVIFLGSFNKVMFPSLRLGYLVSPPSLLDSLLALRLAADFYPPSLDQAILCDFMSEGHMGRHIRRMREMYAGRLACLKSEAKKLLGGLLDISPIQAGLNTVAFLRNGMHSKQAEEAAANYGIEALGLDRFTLKQGDLQGLLLGFAAFDEREIHRGVVSLAAALEQCARRPKGNTFAPGARLPSSRKTRSDHMPH